MPEINAYLCSYPKSGRTWMRFALANLINQKYQLGIKLDMENMFSVIPNDDNSKSQPEKEVKNFTYNIPLIAMTHRQFDDSLLKKPVVFLLRNPADVLVSRFHHLRYHQARIEADLKEFLRDDQVGARNLLSYLSSWVDQLSNQNILTLTYEELRKDTQDNFLKITNQLNLKSSLKDINKALEKSSIENMKKIEKRSGVGEPNPYDRNDPRALRVRQGIVGGFKKDLDKKDLDYILKIFNQDKKVKDLLIDQNIWPENI